MVFVMCKGKPKMWPNKFCFVSPPSSVPCISSVCASENNTYTTPRCDTAFRPTLAQRTRAHEAATKGLRRTDFQRDPNPTKPMYPLVAFPPGLLRLL